MNKVTFCCECGKTYIGHTKCCNYDTEFTGYYDVFWNGLSTSAKAKIMNKLVSGEKDVPIVVFWTAVSALEWLFGTILSILEMIGGNIKIGFAILIGFIVSGAISFSIGKIIDLLDDIKNRM